MSAARWTTKGWIVKRGTTYVLQTRGGNWWPIERVSWLQPFGSVDEGAHKMPRPRTYDAAGGILDPGDTLAVMFTDGNPKEPLIIGTAIDRASQFVSRDYSDGFNRVAVRVAPLVNNTEQGHVELELAADDKGSIAVDATDSVQIDVGTDAQTVRITVQNGVVTIRASSKVVVDAPAVELGTDASEGVLKGRTGAAIYDTHAHGTPFGPTTTPTTGSMTSAVSTVTTTA